MYKNLPLKFLDCFAKEADNKQYCDMYSYINH